MFQSSPTPKGGRYEIELVPCPTESPVSILAHPERWAPTTRRPIAANQNQRVSILAHPERWALHRTRRKG